MLFYNATDETVKLCIDSLEKELKAKESFGFECANEISFTLKHSYQSTALSKEEIRRDNADDSIISLAFSSYKKPYFNVVLDTHYVINANSDAIINIRKEIIRPVYECEYDRLYADVAGGAISKVNYGFIERETFKKYYYEAISEDKKTFISILLVLLCIVGLPLLLLLFAVNLVLGSIAALVSVGLFISVKKIGEAILSAICKADRARIDSRFQSENIAKFFRREKD